MLKTALIVNGDSADAQKALRDLETTMESAEREATQMGQSVGTAATQMAKDAQRAAGSIKALGNESRLSRQHTANLAFQLQDIVVALQMGQNPMQVALQQGGQIGQIMGQAGIGVGGLVKQIGLMVSSFLVANPLLIAAVAAGGLLAAAFVGIKQSADAEAVKAYAGTLGLTKEEMGKLTDVTVTWGDTAKATFQVLAEKAGIDTGKISKFFKDSFHAIGDFGKFSIAVIIAAITTLGVSAYNVFTRLPAMVGEAVIGAANLAISAIEGLVNLGIRGINRLADMVNSSLLGDAIRKVFGTDLPHMAEVSLGRIQNKFAGTLASIGQDARGTFRDTLRAVMGTFDEMSAGATDVAKQRVNAQADEIKGQRKAKDAADAHTGSIRDQTRALHDHIKALTEDASALNLAIPKGALRTGPIGKHEDLQQLFDELPQMKKMIDLTHEWNRSLRGIGTGTLRDVVTGLAAAATGQAKLGDVAEQTFKRMAAALVQLSIEMTILKGVAQIFGAGSGVTSFVSQAFGFGGGRAKGGPVSPGNFYAVNERSTAPGLFIPLAPGRIEPPGNDNGRGGGQQPIVRIEVAASEMFEPAVQRISGNVAVEVVRASAPTITNVAAAETMRRLSRPRL